MRINSFIAVLDTCVLAPMPIADTLLRLAEELAFYLPRWSEHILSELHRTLTVKFHYTEAQARRRIGVMREFFPEALVTGYEAFIPSMKTDCGDAHVLAAAVRCSAHAIITDNKRDFPAEVLREYSIECLSAGEFPEHQYHLDNDGFISLLAAQAEDISRPLSWLISRLPTNVAALIQA
jgi:predicted nucleic acid-binding protein